MSDTVPSPNMNLPVPIVSVDPGPTWAQDLNSCLGIIDQHDHSSGQGVQITPTGLNINTDLTIQGNNLTHINELVFTPLSSSSDLGVVYVSGNELYYNDESGNVVQITNMGSVNAGAGSITGLPSGTASASYSSGTQTFIWQSATSTAANMDGGSFIFREVVANANGVTVSSPTSLAADYQMFWPAGLPGSGTSFMTVDSGGNMGDAIGTTSAFVSTGNIVDQNVTTAKIADQNVTQIKLAPRATGTTVAAGGVAISPACASFSTSSTSLIDVTNLTVTITTTGRPVMLFLQSTSSSSYLTSSSSDSSDAFSIIAFCRGGSDFRNFAFGASSAPISIFTPSSAFRVMDLAVNANPGTYTYNIQAEVVGTSKTVSFTNVELVAYEI